MVYSNFDEVVEFGNLLSTFLHTAAAPPLNVQATQSSASAPVEVSWSPPSSGATNITGYRIFCNGQDVVFLPATITGITLNLFEEDIKLGQQISIRSESSSTVQLPSELISATILRKFNYHNYYCSSVDLFVLTIIIIILSQDLTLDVANQGFIQKNIFGGEAASSASVA